MSKHLLFWIFDTLAAALIGLAIVAVVVVVNAAIEHPQGFLATLSLAGLYYLAQVISSVGRG